MKYKEEADWRRKVLLTYLSKYPYAGKLTLAKILHKEEPALFPDVEAARASIRYYTGATGRQLRINAYRSGSGVFDRAAMQKIMTEEKIDFGELPKSENDNNWGEYVVNSKKCFLMSDLHIPFHNDDALKTAIQYCQDYVPDTIIINGDLVDHYNLSEFLKDPRAKDFEYERKCTLQFLGYLRERFPRARIIWKEGNHEHWYFRYMMKSNGALMKLKHFQIESVYKTDEFKIEYVKDNRPIAIKDLWILHGHELQKQSIGVPVNPARSVYLKAATTMLVGHHHITSEHTTQNAKGHITTTWSVGCLSHLRPPYARFSKYNNGFAIIETDPKSNYFQVYNKKIYKGKVI